MIVLIDIGPNMINQPRAKIFAFFPLVCFKRHK